MLFTSGTYLIFLAIVFLLYWGFASKRWLRVTVLLAASYYFYALWNPRFLAVLFLISSVDFLTARMIGATQRPKLRSTLLALSLLTDVGALVLFKYFNFFSASFAELLSKFGRQSAPLFLTRLALPLGLSFITFRSLSYVIDVYRRTTKPTPNYFEYLTFVAFFPTVIAGPLVRAKELLPQFKKPATLISEDGGRAIFLIILGLTKKIAIANFLANNLVDRVFDQPQLYSSVETLAAIYAYSLQIYCDFSGYTDIAIGSAMLLGFKLPDNFNSPYRAHSLVDFWRRWHITLSDWLRDYVFVSIGGLRKRRVNLYRNLVLTMLIAGLWHGAAWTFVLWGGLHGLGLSVNHWWEAHRRERRRKPSQQWWIRLACLVATFNFVSLGWVLFRAGSLRQTGEVLKRLGSMQFTTGNLATPVVIVLALGYVAHWVPRSALEKIYSGWNWLPSPAQAIVILSVALGLYFVSSTDVQFIYGNF
ncbi:MAG: alginate O-acetyltransferase complex protein AlgI [Blastocatellia bacterium]|jgi:D-alanyl-lipoteichoic acid acyltransferase DltB (MBOAT superfamily)|nr:alginate O-acetyltransferase complex protein AlgI [Blastocatellia bacterium]